MAIKTTEPGGTGSSQKTAAVAGESNGGGTEPSSSSATADHDQPNAPTSHSPQASKIAGIEEKIKAALNNSAPGSSIFFIENVSSQSYARDVTTEYISAGRDAFVRSNQSKDTIDPDDTTLVFCGDLDKWFRAQNDNYFSVCWLLALALLEGCDVPTIAAQSRSFRALFGGADARSRSTSALKVETVGQILVRLGAHRAYPISSQGDQQEREVALFDEAAWRSICLIGIWREIELAPTRIASWLIDLSASSPPQIRRAAAAAIAILLEHDPYGVFDAIIIPLSCGNAAQRWMAADALGIAANGEKRAFISARLTECARLTHGEGASSIAALCIGGTLVRDDPERAAKLTLLLVERWEEVDSALGVAMDALVRHARTDGPSGTTILRALVQWKGWSLVTSDQSNVQHLQSVLNEIVGDPAVPMTAHAAASFVRERSKRLSKPSPPQKAVVAAELVSIMASAILDLSDVNGDQDENNPQISDDANEHNEKTKTAYPSPFAKLAMKDPDITAAAADILVKLLQFAASRQMTWTILREGLTWSNDIKTFGAIALLKQFFRIAPQQEVDRLREHIERWKKDRTIAYTINFYLKSKNVG